ncbi:hypothetical protein HO133_006960 [Letharia lupina]|uniref:Transcription initiation factor TFIID subunit 10 n=1 Tax=Letharia lupina TaxID=560253 RepID=A0A8H6CT19_9LECA|nr:uncharacterized protein HO133_006960 [Letharia lupina]KAF6228849.1 hypothetical protein HO133_006960 [Letharia lupina]
MASPNPNPNPTSAPDPSTTQQPSITDDAELDPDIDMAIDPAPPDPENPALDEALPEPREATRKDISLRDFLGKMDDYAPIIPDAVTQHHLLLAGLSPTTTPLPLARLLALATQKFIADIAADAYQYSRMRSSATGAGQSTTAAAIPGAEGGAGQQAGAGKAGGGGKDDKGKSGQHVLGVQRAGYGGGGGGGGQAGRAVLTMEDLGCAVGEYGVNVKRGEFYR